jgi:asparagine synthase (glutamine-hydrolysing)
MCGITGIFAYSNAAPPVNSQELLQIREVMTARGPDDAGIWLSERIGLAHRRLSIIDLTKMGSQPMTTQDGIFRIVFNGEIYNYRQLRSQLKAKGYSFHTNSDTEVLLQLYAEYGAKMVYHIRGMYAFAIWDDKNKGLFLARDPFGIKPLYYADDGLSFRFASQVKALLKGGEIDITPQAAGHVGFYLWGYVPEPYTLYKGIYSLPAGTSLWIDTTNNHQFNTFFKISEEIAKAHDTISHPDEIRQHLHQAIKDSVQHHLIADVDVGVFLSAGLDSTTLTALASELGIGSLNTITLGFNEYKNTKHDETPLATLVAQHYDTNHQTRFLSQNDFHESLDDLLKAMDQPSTDGVNTYFVSKVAKESGMKVALSGLGGDELLGGYPSFKDVPRMVKLFGCCQTMPIIGKGFRWISAPLLKQFTSPKYASVLEYGGSYSGAYLLRRGLFMPWELPKLMDGDMVKAGWQELQTLLRLDETTTGIDSNHLKVSALELTWYMRNQLLRDSDWAGMAHSLEIRVPLLDINLFRSLLHISTKLPTKQDMAHAPNKPLPAPILDRAKTGFSVPVREWLLQGNDNNKERGLRAWAKQIHQQS